MENISPQRNNSNNYKVRKNIRALAFYIRMTLLIMCIQFLMLFLIPVVNVYGTDFQRISSYIVATIFWSCLVIIIVLIFKTSGKRRLLEKNIENIRLKRKYRLGIISFFKNQEAMIADLILFVSFVFSIVLIAFEINVDWLVYIMISLFFFTFNLHCLLNGKNYRYLKLYKKIQEGERKQCFAKNQNSQNE